MSEAIDVTALIAALDRESLVYDRAAALVRQVAEDERTAARRLERVRLRIIEGGKK